MKVAIVYDRVNKIGGAERVVESVSELFPTATLFTSVYDKQKSQWARKFTVKTSFLQKIPFLRNRHELIPYLMPLAFESFNFADYDLVISITSEASKGIIVGPGTKHVCICLTPTRYLWSGYDEYFKNLLLRFLTKPIVWYLRRWDLIAAARPDEMIAISDNVRQRIKKYYGRHSEVVFPPADRLFTQKLEYPEINERDFFLVVSRLVDYKRIDLAVKACNKLKLPLIIIGSGAEFEKLDALSGPTIKFMGKVSDAKLVAYYKNCRALIFPGEEDFGITMVEAQLAGKPVIAFGKGGALEIVENGKTGVYFKEQTVASLFSVLKKFNDNRYNTKDCKKNALLFSEKLFQRKFMRLLQSKKYI